MRGSGVASLHILHLMKVLKVVKNQPNLTYLELTFSFQMLVVGRVSGFSDICLGVTSAPKPETTRCSVVPFRHANNLMDDLYNINTVRRRKRGGQPLIILLANSYILVSQLG